MRTKHLIVGAGPAGLAAIDTIRQFGDDSPITLVCDEPPYSRMVLPYLMDGTIPEQNVYTASDDYLDQKSVTGVFGHRVHGIDPAGTAYLDDDTSISFENALLATGSRATRPAIPGIDGSDVFNLWTLDDAKDVLHRKGGEVVVIGAGFIAFTCLDALVALGAKVTVVEVDYRILPRMIDEQGAALVRAWLESKGVAFRVGSRVTAIEDHDGRKRVVTGDAEPLLADIVIVATGIRPNLDLIDGSGIATDFGILVDDHMRTSAPNIFAAGDIAQGPAIGASEKQVHAIQPTALEHGRVAGANMAGADISYWGSLLMNIVDVQKLQIASFGEWGPDGGKVILNEDRPAYRKLVFEDERLVGAILLGRPHDVAMLNDMGMAKGLIQSQVSLGKWREHLQEHPLDIRRAYVASRAAERLLEMRLLLQPSSGDGYRSPDPAPTYWPHHETFVSTIPKDAS